MAEEQQQIVHDKLHVRISSPDKMIWEGEAKSVSSVNSDGPFDILPLHTNFITIIDNTPIRVNTGDDIQDYTFPHSVIYAHENTVLVFTNL